MNTNPAPATLVAAPAENTRSRAWRRLTAHVRFDAHPVAGPMLASLALVTGVPMVLAASGAAVPLPLRQAAPAAATAGVEQRHEQAMRTYRARHWPLAYVRFAELADQGHAPSALMALTMLRHGSWMFGSQWSATMPQIEHWSSLAMRDLAEQRALLSGDQRAD